MAILFGGLAIIGLLILVLGLIGVDADTDIDIDVDADLDGSAFTSILGWFSTQVLGAGLLVGGAAGFLSASSDWPAWLVIVAFFSGCIPMMIAVKRYVLPALKKNEFNSVFSTRDLIGKIGQVSLRIPAGQVGQVTLNNPTGGRMTLEAISADADEIPHGTTVIVIDTVDSASDRLIVMPSNIKE